MNYNLKTPKNELHTENDSTYLKIPDTVKEALDIPVVKVAITATKVVVGTYVLIYGVKLVAKLVSAFKELTKEVNS